MKLRLNRIAYPVTVTGPGRRLGIWVQGCYLRCFGCGFRDSWDPDGGEEFDVAQLAAELAQVIINHELSGINLSGGEPTEQAQPLTQLLRIVLATVDFPPDVLLFTGLSAAAAERRAPSLWNLADAVVAGPYRADQATQTPLIASANQQLILRTQLGNDRYADTLPANLGFQTQVGPNRIALVGQPAPGGFAELAAALARRGILVKSPTEEPN